MPLRLFVNRVYVQLPSLHGLWELRDMKAMKLYNVGTYFEKIADVEGQS